jgi:chemotaxis protein histidine kinase CheA
MNATLVDLREFLMENYAMLDRLEPRLARGGKTQGLEKPWQHGLDSIHGLRKKASALGLGQLEALARRAELVLTRLATGHILPQPTIIGYLMNLTEEIRRGLLEIEARGVPGSSSVAPPENGILSIQAPPWTQKKLIFRTPDDGRMLIPFDHVMRIEAFAESSVEKGPEFDSLRRQDRLVPLLDISRLLPERRVIFRRPPVVVPRGQSRQMIVYVTPQGEVGLVVDAVLDVLKASVQVEFPATRPGVMGSATLNERITELLDIPVILAQSGITQPLQVA